MILKRQPGTLIVLVLLAGTTAGVLAILALARSSDAGPRFDVTQAFSVFKTLPARPAPPAIANSDIARRDQAEIAQTRILRDNVGRFHSQFVIFPAHDRQNLCYGVFPALSSDPGVLYCYSPGNPSAPSGIAGEHFSVAAPESVSGGEVGVQLFGVVDDEVTSIRVRVAGAWRSVAHDHNGFYLDLPGVSYDQIGNLEATIKDGSLQVHDIQTATRLQ
jgi:hypothetical protein